ncbi:DNA helicase MCM8 isoform X2 [Toxorhynchites rutilus septentrionalis]|uniref:DNA helicase MCM8 isoform X2 n=1 Tax=Toxorhynchites rutilus septentrionalis TaxID=329112 RepID=UPI00247B0187|nr:DNA helicase MCM8 isoform X2 [Toxorhynchites rutilus septentrionalis]
MDPPAGPSGLPGGSKRSRGRGRPWRGRGSWRPYNNRAAGNCGPPREKPVGYGIPPTSDCAVDSSSMPLPGVSQNQPFLSVMLEREPCEYPGWKLYLPQEGYREGSKTLNQIHSIETHYSRYSDHYNTSLIKTNFWFELNIAVVEADADFRRDWPSFRQDLIDSPEQTLAMAGLAMHQTVTKSHQGTDKPSQLPESSPSSSTNKLMLQIIRPRIVGHGPEVHLRQMKVNSFGKLISVRGTVIRAASSQILNSWMTFSCSLCHGQQAIQQTDGLLVVPNSCRDGCKARSNFVPLRSSIYTRTEAFQTIRLQESMLGARAEHGQVPRSIEVVLTQELVDAVCPGDDVTITGILKGRRQEENSFKARNTASMYKMYIQAVAVRSNKNTLKNWHRSSDFSDLDMEAIQAIKSEPSPFRLLIQSLCPLIYGHEMVKAGLLLGIVGGSAIAGGRRSEIHVLVVGDPGIGKSQILQSCAEVSPRGIFVCGNSTSNAGLTVAVRTEKGSGGSLEAGALVLADQGVCCIDEFDKMAGNHQVLLEAMEQQVVSVAKAGVICSLPARTCILAAANPAGGHYDKSKTISENLKMKPALLSRFDLVFIQLDRPNEQLDNLLTAHVQRIHGMKSGQFSQGAAFQALLTDVGSAPSQGSAMEAPLSERLKLRGGEKMDLLPVQLIQKYIAYARKNINPKLTKEAALLIRDFYIELRRAQQGMDSIPVTTRQLEGLIRLTQARARVDLETKATLKHAQDVIEILRFSMIDAFSNDVGDLQPSRLMNGIGTSQSTLVKKFVQMLQRKATVENKTIFSIGELKQMAGGSGMDFNRLLDALNVQGFLLKKDELITLL